MLRLSSLAAALVVLHLGLAALAGAQAPVSLGVEFQINSFTTGAQSTSSGSVDREANGDFVVVWASSGQDGSVSGVFGQRFASSGAKIGAEFQVNTYTLHNQVRPVVGSDADGDFVVAWDSYDQDGSASSIVAQRFNSLGVRQDAQFQVNELFTLGQLFSTVGLDADGDFVIAWQTCDQGCTSYGIAARRFDSLGAAQGIEMQVNQYVNGYQKFPSLGMGGNGSFVVAWQSAGQDGSGEGIFARDSNAMGYPTGPDIFRSTPR